MKFGNWKGWLLISYNKQLFPRRKETSISYVAHVRKEKKIKKVKKKNFLFDICNEGKLGNTLPFRLDFLIEHLDSEQEQEQKQEERSGKKTLGGWHSLCLPPPWVQPKILMRKSKSRIFLNIFISIVLDEVKHDFFFLSFWKIAFSGIVISHLGTHMTFLTLERSLLGPTNNVTSIQQQLFQDKRFD